MKSMALRFVVGGIALLGLPLLGVWLAGLPLARYAEVPPTTFHAPGGRSSATPRP